MAILLVVWRRRHQVLQLHPLRREGIKEALDFRIGQHPRDGRIQNLRLDQFTTGGQLKQLVVWRAAPEEIGEAGRQFEVTCAGLGLVAIEEERRRECRRRGLLHGISERQPLLDIGQRKGNVTIERPLLHVAPKGPGQERLQALGDFSRHVGVGTRLFEEVAPDTNRLVIEIGALQDRYTELEKRIQQQRGHAQLIRLIIEAV